MSPVRRPPESSESGPPTRYAEGPPPPNPAEILPLTAVLDITRNIGSLTTGVENLTTRVGKMEDTVHQLHRQMYAALVLVTVFGGVAVWLLDKIWDAAKISLALLKVVPK